MSQNSASSGTALLIPAHYHPTKSVYAMYVGSVRFGAKFGMRSGVKRFGVVWVKESVGDSELLTV